MFQIRSSGNQIRSMTKCMVHMRDRYRIFKSKKKKLKKEMRKAERGKKKQGSKEKEGRCIKEQHFQIILEAYTLWINSFHIFRASCVFIGRLKTLGIPWWCSG